MWSPDFEVHSGSLGSPHCHQLVSTVVQEFQSSVTGHQEVVGVGWEVDKAVDGTGYPRPPYKQTLASLWNNEYAVKSRHIVMYSALR